MLRLPALLLGLEETARRKPSKNGRLCPNPTRGLTPCQAPPHRSPEVSTTAPPARSALLEHLCAAGPSASFTGDGGESRAVHGAAVRRGGPSGEREPDVPGAHHGRWPRAEGGPTEEELQLTQSPRGILLPPSHPTRHSLMEITQGRGHTGRHAALLAGGRAGTAVRLLVPRAPGLSFSLAAS
ncbi:unnamed protein product [Rangifer tarandus platyrhynchus]|uniref:Uncharacterized protein n=1 Tax=Rangifer tarandus platyrhynchus TaxID=3082113 RepID=A0AC59YWN4_RANTA